MSLNDVKLNILKGDFDKHEFWHALGELENSTTDAAGEDVYRGSDFTPDAPVRLLQPADAGEQMTLISESNAGNGATATGVLTVRIYYLDAAGVRQTEDITLNGTTGVDTVATDIRFVNDIHALTVGSNGVAEGNIGIYKKGGSIALNLYNMITLGGNKSLVPHRMVPAGHTFYLLGWRCSEAQGKRAAFRIRSTDLNGVLIPGVFNFKGTAYMNNSDSGDMDLAFKIPALSVVKVSLWADQVDAEGACSYWGVLKED